MINDFVGELIQRVLEAADRGGKDEVRREEIKIRQQWGGDRVYVNKGVTEGKARALGGGIAAGLSRRDAFALAGVSRATGYRLMRRRWR